MTQSEVWPTNCRIIEIYPADARLANAVVRSGHHGYLGVVPREYRRQSIIKASPHLAEVVTTATTPQIVRQNNAELLILSGWSALRLWLYRDVRHAQAVVWKLSLHPISLLATLGWLIRYIFGQYKAPARLNQQGFDGAPPGYLVSRITRRKRGIHAQRHFIPHKLGLRGLFSKFHESDVSYVVLRWFEELPEHEPNGDIDVLVADEDQQAVLQILQSGPAVRPCDLYTPTSLTETSYQTVSYYPPEVARRMLKNARLHRGYCRVPSESDYFHSLAYHAVYHKGRKSNLPGAETYRTAKRSSRDFKSLLPAMAAQLGIKVEIGLKSLHKYLQQREWSPPVDWLARLAATAPHDRWLAELVAEQSDHPSLDRGFTVFVIRQSAVDCGMHERIVELIRQSGFVIMARKNLTGTESEYGAARTRGGNWGPGPKDHDGGAPAILVAAYDPNPLMPTKAQRKRFPHIVNARILVKEQFRQQINREIAPQHPINGVHSSDFGAESHHFLYTFAPELVSSVHDQIIALRDPNNRRRMAA